MKTVILALSLVCLSCSAPQEPAADTSAAKDLASWQVQAQNVTIIRDDWGIAHVYGKTDADAVFGLDLRAGRGRLQSRRDELPELAWAASPRPKARREIYRDLRMKLFIDPDDMKAKYAASPDWLKALMNAWADGLNYYLLQAPAGEAARHHATSSRGWRSRSAKAASAATSSA